jgi:hypothetical protein
MRFKKYYYPVILCVIAMAIWSCNKSGDDAPVVGKTSQLNVINAVTDIRAIDFYLNGCGKIITRLFTCLIHRVM